MSPGKVNAICAHMTFEGCLVQPITIPILEDMNSFEIIEQIVFQAIGKLYGGGAYKQGHGFVGFDVDIIKGLDFDKMLYPRQETDPPRSVQTGIIGVAGGKEGVIVT